MRNVINKTDKFLVWIDDLKDHKGRAWILSRIVAAELGNFGDCSPVGDGISEMRIHHGPGYRVYFAQEGIKTFTCLLPAAIKAARPGTLSRLKSCGRI